MKYFSYTRKVGQLSRLLKIQMSQGRTSGFRRWKVCFSESFRPLIYVQNWLEWMVQRTMPIIILTHPESLFKILVKSTTSTEKKMMKDVHAARESLDNGGIFQLRWIMPTKTVSDRLQKYKPCDVLKRVLETGILHVKVEKWIELLIATTSDEKMFTALHQKNYRVWVKKHEIWLHYRKYDRNGYDHKKSHYY